jgi:hypothetical protein
MNRWNIPHWLEKEIEARDTRCVYCGVSFLRIATSRGERPSWEHIVNDETIITRENIARCCMSCNASKGTKDLAVWLGSRYCVERGITPDTVAPVIKASLTRPDSHKATGKRG